MKTSLYGSRIKNYILNLLFPIKCLGCNKKNEIFCNTCLSKLRPVEREIDRNIEALFDYRDPLVKKIIWELKYHHKHYLGHKLGQLLYEFYIEEISSLKMSLSGQAIIVIPIPISHARLRLRGYNQASSIAKGFISCESKNVFDLQTKIVFKKIENSPQAKITNRQKRLKNIQGVFAIKNNKIIKGRTIIVIDDVTTTGGTINEVIMILKKAGAKKVLGLAVAH